MNENSKKKCARTTLILQYILSCVPPALNSCQDTNPNNGSHRNGGDTQHYRGSNDECIVVSGGCICSLCVKTSLRGVFCEVT